MSDFLSSLTEEDAPIAREVTIKGETGTIWFRKISGGEKAQLLKGQKVTHVPGSRGSYEVDLGENENQKHLLVHFSVCDERGKRAFNDIRDVRKLQQYKLDALFEIATEVNKEEDEDLGKS